MTKTQCDAVVLGAGPAGYVCAIRLAQYGKKVVCVEQSELGGTCLNVGCIPSKALISAGHFLESIKHASDMGITVGDPELDIQKLVSWKEKVVKRLTGGIGMLLKSRGVEVLRGRASLLSAGKLEVATPDGKVVVEARDVVLATGSEPAPIPGFDFGPHVWSSTEALSPTEIPKRLLVIGGGVIGMELGLFYRQAGSEVTIVEFMDQLLPGIDPELVKVVQRRAKKAGIKIHVSTAAQSFSEESDGLTVAVETKGKTKEIQADKILLTVGRRPVAPSGLEAAGLKTDKRGFLETNDCCQTKTPHIYAIGDLCHGPMLAHKGSAEGLVAAGHIAGKGGAKWDHSVVPGVIFTDPEIACVGLSEAEAKEQGLEVKIGRFNFAANGRALSMHAAEGLVKVVTNAADDSLLGVHMVGPNVTDMISEAAVAIEAGLTAEDISLTIHPHPTLSEVFMEACEDVHGLCVHSPK
ncbi:MAG: dihydrolipoyl dehydrogenase [Planctomycetota bacterium]|jgi:dihydrolipoamide dehydrogenase|nr:dihydrolipoyl dehydrogenase [Planctomycetota bacterium]